MCRQILNRLSDFSNLYDKSRNNSEDTHLFRLWKKSNEKIIVQIEVSRPM